jgi:hypothetical protein
MLTPVNPIGQTIPPGMSQAMLVKGNLLFLSGHVSVGPAGSLEPTLKPNSSRLSRTLRGRSKQLARIFLQSRN